MQHEKPVIFANRHDSGPSSPLLRTVAPLLLMQLLQHLLRLFTLHDQKRTLSICLYL